MNNNQIPDYVQNSVIKNSPTSQKKLVYILASIPLLLIIFFFIVVPAISSFILAFKDYTPMSGIANSDWVGVENFARLTQDYMFTSLFSNSLLLSVLPALLSVGLGVLIAFVAVGAPTKLRALTTGALLLPFFVPMSIYMQVTNRLPSQLLISSIVILIYTAAVSLRSMFLVAFVCTSLGNATMSKSLGAKKGIFLGAAIMLCYSIATCLSADYNAVNLIQNHLNVEFTQVIDTYIYRTGLMFMEVGLSSAAWLLKVAIQSVLLIVVCAIMSLIRRGRNNTAPVPIMQAEKSNSTSFLGAIIAIVMTIAVLLAFYMLMIPLQSELANIPVSAGAFGSSSQPFLAIGNSLLYSILASILFFIFTGALGYLGYKIGNVFSFTIIAIVALLSNNIMGNYLFYHSLGAINTIFAPINSYMISAPLLLVFILLNNASCGKNATFGQWIKSSLPLLLLLTGITAANVWGETMPQTMYISDISMAGISVVALQMPLLSLWTPIVVATLIIGVISILLYGFLSAKFSPQTHN